KRQQVPDLKQYVCNLEQWIINSLQAFDIEGKRVDGRIGIWVSPHPILGDASDHPLPTGEGGAPRSGEGEGIKKIAAIGVRVRHWVAYHGLSINVNPDLSHFNGIVPCGISDAGVTSFADLKKPIDMRQLDAVLQKQF